MSIHLLSGPYSKEDTRQCDVHGSCARRITWHRGSLLWRLRRRHNSADRRQARHWYGCGGSRGRGCRGRTWCSMPRCWRPDASSLLHVAIQFRIRWLAPFFLCIPEGRKGELLHAHEQIQASESGLRPDKSSMQILLILYIWATRKHCIA